MIINMSDEKREETSLFQVYFSKNVTNRPSILPQFVLRKN